MKTLDVKILDPRLREVLPQYSTAGAAGLDLRACIQSPLTLTPGRHRIEVRASGYQTMAFDADVTPGQVIPYQGTLQR